MSDLIYCNKKDLEKAVQKAVKKIMDEHKDQSTELFTTKEVADHFKISEATVGNWRKEGKIEFIQKGSVIRYTKEQINNVCN